MDKINDLITDRQKVHGEFSTYSYVDQRIKAVISDEFRKKAPAYIVSGLDMIASKMARILAGEPEFPDHWIDIQGYGKAVEQCLPSFYPEPKQEKKELTQADFDELFDCISNLPEVLATAMEQAVTTITGSKPTDPRCPCVQFNVGLESSEKPKKAKKPLRTVKKCSQKEEEETAFDLSVADINTYNNIRIDIIDARTITGNTSLPSSGEIDRCKIKLACDLTMKKVDIGYEFKEAAESLIANLFNAEHESVFEHCNITLLASGISRSLLGQIVRQGTFRFTSASQQYQDYRNYPMSLHPNWKQNTEVAYEYRKALNDGLAHYTKLVALGEKPEEARQVLPPAATVNLEITANARNIARFLRTRLCKRNVDEMTIFAWKLYNVCMEWLPELFSLIHAPCIMDGKCNQGKMSCGRPYYKGEFGWEPCVSKKL